MSGKGTPASAAIEYRVLGPLEIHRAGETVRLPGERQRTLLALLLAHPNEVVSRDYLIAEAFGERASETAVNALQAAISRLRKLLGSSAIETRPLGYLVNVESDGLDLFRFGALGEEARAHMEAGDLRSAAARLREALALWRGPPFADLAACGLAQPEIGRLEAMRLAALMDRIDVDLALGRAAEVVGELERLVEEHPYQERLRGQLMLALYRADRQAEALDAYRATRRLLVDELGIEPSRPLRALEQAILTHDESLLVRRADTEPRPALPSPVSSFVGRRAELAALRRLLERADARLITLLGPGGSGKTRLALELAREAAGHFSGGALFVDLAAVTDPALVGSAIGRALQLKEHPGVPYDETLAAALAQSHLLLVLDNFEHLLEAAPDVVGMLERAAGLRILVTSRAVLRVSGEHVFEVPPLEESDAVDLFRRRAQALASSTAGVDEPVVIRLCRRLDHLPLAVELAAARTRALSPEEILDRLESPLEVLTVGPRDAPLRHQTLRGTLDWSHGLLGRDEQQLFARLAVFTGGWTAEAAAAVCDGRPDAVERLVEQSLVRHARGRFSMLETVREYAAERLAASAEAEGVRLRHARFFLDVAAEGEYELGGRRLRWLERLEVEHDNLRAALSWCRAAGEHGLLLRLAAALGRFWDFRGYLSEGRRWLEEALAAGRGEPPAVRAKAMKVLCDILEAQGDYAAAEAGYRETRALYAEAGDESGVARCLRKLGAFALRRGEEKQGRALLQLAVDTAIDAGDPLAAGVACLNLGDLELKRGCPQEGQMFLARSRSLLGAIPLSDAAVALLHKESEFALANGSLEEASRLLAESAEAARTIGWQQGLVQAVDSLGALAAARGDAREAVVLFAAAERRAAAIGLRYDAEGEALQERRVAELRKILGEREFVAARDEGSGLDVDGALARLSA